MTKTEDNKIVLDTDNVFEMAMVLGKALKKDPRMVRMDAAKEAYEKDPELMTLMSEYEVQQKAAENVATGEDFDPQMIQLIQDRIDELYRQITEHPTYQELAEAQEAVNALMEAVNNTITYAITGEVPSNCTHDCSTCSGCH
ncbi:MAG: YlbF family regulator [Clostridia bacterium]|nr:YlbF family regulator [Clostridia bacterium]